jgi:hypothetical protein
MTHRKFSEYTLADVATIIIALPIIWTILTRGISIYNAPTDLEDIRKRVGNIESDVRYLKERTYSVSITTITNKPEL